MCGCTGKNFSCWSGSTGGALGLAVTFTTNGLYQSPVPNVTEGGVAPPPGEKRVSVGSNAETSAWPSVRRLIVTGADGACVSRRL